MSDNSISKNKIINHSSSKIFKSKYSSSDNKSERKSSGDRMETDENSKPLTLEDLLKMSNESKILKNKRDKKFKKWLKKMDKINGESEVGEIEFDDE